VLELKNVSVSYGSIRAVKGVSLIVDTGEAVSLIGANGAGKTTILQTISGLLRPVEGEILLDGVSIAGRPAEKIVAMGLCHVPEGRQVFSGMSVWENLRLGAYLIKDDKEIRARMEAVFALFPILARRLRQPAGTLSGGEQQMLAIGRGLMGKPHMLLLDEPSLGLSPVITRQVFDVLKDLGGQGVAMLLVEQNAYEAMGITSRTYILENGAVSMAGDSRALAEDPHIKEAYLGR
jgi:branched-chain amino acid transport system ATP-binding protein